MFFGKIDTWSTRKNRIINTICFLIYGAILVVAPFIIISTNYDLFGQVDQKIKLSGVGLLFFVVLGITAYLLIKKALRQFPKTTLNEQRLAYTLELIFDSIPFIIILVWAFVTRDNVERAFNTMIGCIISYFCAMIWHNLTIKYLETWNAYRSKAKESNIVETLKSKV